MKKKKKTKFKLTCDIEIFADNKYDARKYLENGLTHLWAYMGTINKFSIKKTIH